jgi:dethiobiotin synthetase
VAGIFVSGTGTDVGKTFVTAALIQHRRNVGRPVNVFKPVVTGFDPMRPADSDSGILLAALGRPAAELDRISPWRFTAPLAPDLAAKAEGKAVDFRALVDFTRQAVNEHGTVLIEGIGGIMVPLDQTHTVLDWISAVRIPVLLVAGSYLGTISHTLTALHVLAQRNLDIAGVVVSESALPGASLDDTVSAIARFAVPLEVIGIPRLPASADIPPALLDRLDRLLERG